MSFLRRYFPRTYLARRNLYRARTRTTLAILTVAIGVVAVGGLGLFGLAFEADQQETLGDLETEITVEGPGGTFGLSSDDTPSFDQRRLETIRSVAGEYDADVTVFRQGSFPSTDTITSDDFPARAIGVKNPRPVYGEFVQAGEIPADWRSGAIITTIVNQFRDTPLEVGDPVQVDGRLQRVVAVIEDPVGFQGGFGELERVGTAALLPVDLVEPDDDDQPYQGVIIDAADTREADEISTRLETALNGPLREEQDKFGIETVEEEAETIDQQLTSTARFLLAIGGISLVIAGISITNVQLMSARERRQEIGVLRAVGYGRLDVLAIMLIEAVFMGLLAAAIGLGLTLGAGAVINDLLLGDPMAFQPGTLLYLGGAFGFGVLICVLAGLYPAWKASRERPVDALEA